MAALVDPLTLVERTYVDALQTAFGTAVREVRAVPPDFGAAEMERILTTFPGVYVATLGGRRSSEATLQIGCTVAVYVVAQSGAGDVARRQGTGATPIGAFAMAAIAATAVDRLVVDGIVTARVVAVEPVQAQAFGDQGLTCFAVTTEIPVDLNLTDFGILADFVTFHGDWDVPVHGNVEPPLPAAAPDAADTVILQEAP